MTKSPYTLTAKSLLDARVLDSEGSWSIAYQRLAEIAPEQLRTATTMAAQLARACLPEGDQAAFVADVRGLYQHQAAPGRIPLPAMPAQAAGAAAAKTR